LRENITRSIVESGRGRTHEERREIVTTSSGEWECPHPPLSCEEGLEISPVAKRPPVVTGPSRERHGHGVRQWQVTLWFGGSLRGLFLNAPGLARGFVTLLATQHCALIVGRAKSAASETGLPRPKGIRGSSRDPRSLCSKERNVPPGKAGGIRESVTMLTATGSAAPVRCIVLPRYSAMQTSAISQSRSVTK